ncbi:MAG TPA: hypothetical protein VKE40_09685 [Gemmataceae bacterium]|nr:hypothetical protein [Gemmataceae bacterium]
MPGLCIAVLAALPAVAQEPGQTPRPTPMEPIKEPPEEELVQLDKTLEYFRFVEDDAPMIFRGQQISDVRRSAAAANELTAYNYVLAHARRQPVERLQKYATRNVPVANLFRPIRQDYLRELLHFDGRLSLVLAMKPTEDLKSLAGIDQLYEAWIFPRGSNKLVCLVVSELPEGVKPGEDQNSSVSFDAYYFKLWHYESRQPLKDSKDKDKHQWQQAPLFLGRTFEVTGPVAAEPAGPYSGTMLGGLAGGIALLIALAVGFTIWFRRGDRHTAAASRRRLEQTATFDDVPDAPAAPVNRISEHY